MAGLAVSLPKDCPVGKPRKRTAKGLEGPVVRDCMRFLTDCPDVIYVERRNTGAVQFEGGGFMRFGKKGASDIWCLVEVSKGSCGDTVDVLEHTEIECKRADGKGRQSEAQKEFQEFCESHRIPYILTISALDLAEKIRAIVLDT